MRQRTRYTLLAVLILFCALAVVLYLRQKAPPEAARLLPESDAIVYLHLKPLRAATHFDRNPVSPASFQSFIDATGILPERDLDAIALALNAQPDPAGPNGPVAFSIIWQGHFDSVRLARYLASIAPRTENYGGRTIYCVPSQGRIVRVALLGYDTVATSNTPTPEQIHSILDRHLSAASPFSGSSLLGARYGDVPAFSSAWAIGRLGLPFITGGKINLLGFDLPLPPDSTFIASLRYTSTLNLRVDQLATSDSQAETTTRALTNLLSFVRVVQQAQQPTAPTPADAAFHTFMDSVTIQQHKDRTTLTATLPPESLKNLTTHAR